MRLNKYDEMVVRITIFCREPLNFGLFLIVDPSFEMPFLLFLFPLCISIIVLLLFFLLFSASYIIFPEVAADAAADASAAILQPS